MCTGQSVVQLQLRISSGLSRAQQMLQALRSPMASARLDRGCAGRWLYVDVSDSRELCYVKEWAAPADLERELTRFARLLSVMEGAPRPPTWEFRFSAHTRGLDDVEQVRVPAGPRGPLTAHE